MKYTLKISAFVLCFLTLGSLYANQGISGSVTVSDSLKSQVKSTGVLFIFAKTDRPGPPAAVLRIAGPKFPQKFTLGPENAMMPGTPFDGPFTITARYTDTGNAMQREGSLEGKSKTTVKPGASGVAIQIDTRR